MSRSVLVTGGSRGIGLGIARAFAGRGDRTAVTYRTGEPPEGLLGVRCDVRDTASVEAAVAEVADRQGPVQVLVANAGITRDGLLLASAEADFAEVLDTNLLGAARCVRAVLPDMLRARAGRIILLSSAIGLMGAAGQANYAASKAGLLGLARSLAWELGPRNITVNVVAPGYIETDMTQNLTDKRKSEIRVLIPMRRSGSVDDVVGAVTYLASAGAGYVTGAFLPVGGGLGMGS
ncbi:SDR family oxidoreductase [Streptomyces sp. HPF1205]|uniref:SDR family oxidoreductase n=1 Tax=Streptomyces sp. HPF1205 TaxID=2873262 RepID=UPI001CEC911D|nr:SDR family oxidoreductase [Streptomyces sp. HPF1205]